MEQVRGSGVDSLRSIITLAQFNDYMPEPKIAHFLQSHFFEKSSFHWLWPILNKHCFEVCNSTGTTLERHLSPNIEFYAVVCMVFAIALQFLPETNEDVSII